jgi:N-formylglutamate amidohydrolase
MKPLIHVPHASTVIPREVREQFILNDEELTAEAIESADLHTDELARAAWPSARILTANVSRLVVDVERFADDSEEQMANFGRGMVYTATHLGNPLRRKITESEKNCLQLKYYEDHWQKLKQEAKNSVLVDLHSYPKIPWVVEPHRHCYRPEIDIGTDELLSPREWIIEIKSHFEKNGFTVGLNTPYAGVINAGSDFAAMIEIRRDVMSNPSDYPRWGRIVGALATMPMPKFTYHT